MNVDDLENEYLNIIEPENLIQEFKNDEEFIEWLNLGTKEDLKHCLMAFIKAELYHHCTIINKIIKEELC